MNASNQANRFRWNSPARQEFGSEGRLLRLERRLLRRKLLLLLLDVRELRLLGRELLLQRREVLELLGFRIIGDLSSCCFEFVASTSNILFRFREILSWFSAFCEMYNRGKAVECR